MTPVRPAIMVAQPPAAFTPAPELAQWERDLADRLALDWEKSPNALHPPYQTPTWCHGILDDLI
ncbi:hypothetical protein [Actinomadura flavalba]|uniref:hypothetical protein n=1 Tax=Actinomadura flavalba TaxID=1120938 RepID=UPI00037D15D8|nr:hypothetical protein [Actinomadura flavalba]